MALKTSPESVTLNFLRCKISNDKVTKVFNNCGCWRRWKKPQQPQMLTVLPDFACFFQTGCHTCIDKLSLFIAVLRFFYHGVITTGWGWWLRKINLKPVKAGSWLYQAHNLTKTKKTRRDFFRLKNFLEAFLCSGRVWSYNSLKVSWVYETKLHLRWWSEKRAF